MENRVRKVHMGSPETILPNGEKKWIESVFFIFNYNFIHFNYKFLGKRF